MRSGVKNCYVSILRPTETKSPVTNAPVYSSPLWRNAWANQEARRGREVVIDGKPAYETYIRWDFDYLDIDGIRSTDIIEFEGVQYGVTGLLPDLATKQNFMVDTVAQLVGTERA